MRVDLNVLALLRYERAASSLRRASNFLLQVSMQPTQTTAIVLSFVCLPFWGFGAVAFTATQDCLDLLGGHRHSIRGLICCLLSAAVVQLVFLWIYEESDRVSMITRMMSTLTNSYMQQFRHVAVALTLTEGVLSRSLATCQSAAFLSVRTLEPLHRLAAAWLAAALSFVSFSLTMAGELSEQVGRRVRAEHFMADLLQVLLLRIGLAMGIAADLANISIPNQFIWTLRCTGKERLRLVLVFHLRFVYVLPGDVENSNAKA